MAIFFRDGNPVSIDSGYNNQQQINFPNNAVYYNGSVIKIRQKPSDRDSYGCNDIMYYNNSSVPMQLIGSTCNYTSAVYSSTGDVTISFDGRLLKNGSTTIATYSLQGSSTLDSVYIVLAVQGGGGGGSGGNNGFSGGGGGGGGMTVVGINIPRNQSIKLKVGNGGAGGSSGNAGQDGSASYIIDSNNSTIAKAYGANRGIIHETSGGLGGGGWIDESHRYYGGRSTTKTGGEGGGASEAGNGLSFTYTNDYSGLIINATRSGGSHGLSGGGGASVYGGGGYGGPAFSAGGHATGPGGGGGGGAVAWLGGYIGGNGAKGIIYLFTDIGQSIY